MKLTFRKVFEFEIPLDDACEVFITSAIVELSYWYNSDKELEYWVESIDAIRVNGAEVGEKSWDIVGLENDIRNDLEDYQMEDVLPSYSEYMRDVDYEIADARYNAFILG